MMHFGVGLFFPSFKHLMNFKCLEIMFFIFVFNFFKWFNVDVFSSTVYFFNFYLFFSFIFISWYIYTMEYYSAIKKNTFESVLMRWMKLEPIKQSEVSQKDKHRWFFFLFLLHWFIFLVFTTYFISNFGPVFGERFLQLYFPSLLLNSFLKLLWFSVSKVLSWFLIVSCS